MHREAAAQLWQLGARFCNGVCRDVIPGGVCRDVIPGGLHRSGCCAQAHMRAGTA